MLNRIRAANERLHAEGAKRGLNLAGKEFVNGKNVDDNSIKELPKAGRKNKIDIIEEPKDKTKIKVKEDEPKIKMKEKRPDPIIPVGNDDEEDDRKSFEPIIQV